MNRSAPASRRSQSGVVLLTAIIMVALATVVAAAIAFDTAMMARRAAGGSALDQSLLIAGGAEALAAYALSEQLRQSNAVVHGDQIWAKPIGPLEVVPGVLLEAQLTDLQGRFNLNDLVDRAGVRNDVAVEVFERLLDAVGLESQWADLMVDWLDADNNPEPQGAEDSAYTSENPGYRAANRGITSASELLALRGFGAERYRKLAPFVTALPRGTPINLCTASGALLDALSNQRQWTQAPDALARNRAGKCFPNVTIFQSTADAQVFAKLQQSLPVGETSTYFSLRSLTSIGTAQFALYSLLSYESGAAAAPRVRVVIRSSTP
jgi:general secretion pathway protein K